MIRLLLWALLIYVGYRVVKSLSAPKGAADKPEESRPDASITYQDPVCGMYVTEEDAVVGRVGDDRHYFCSRDCLDRYKDKLEKNR